MKTQYVERRLYYFQCEVCGHPSRHTFKRRKAREKICRSCRRTQNINKNQMELFPVKEKAI